MSSLLEIKFLERIIAKRVLLMLMLGELVACPQMPLCLSAGCSTSAAESHLADFSSPNLWSNFSSWRQVQVSGRVFSCSKTFPWQQSTSSSVQSVTWSWVLKKKRKTGYVIKNSVNLNELLDHYHPLFTHFPIDTAAYFERLISGQVRKSKAFNRYKKI